MTIPSSQANLTRKSPREHLKDVVGTVVSLDTKQLIDPIRKATKIRAKKLKMSIRKTRVLKETLKEKDIEICQNNCALIVEIMDILPGIACKHAIMPVLLKKVSKTTKWRICFLDNTSVCEECVMMCADLQYEDADEDVVVYGDQGINTE